MSDESVWFIISCTISSPIDLASALGNLEVGSSSNMSLIAVLGRSGVGVDSGMLGAEVLATDFEGGITGTGTSIVERPPEIEYVLYWFHLEPSCWIVQNLQQRGFQSLYYTLNNFLCILCNTYQLINLSINFIVVHGAVLGFLHGLRALGDKFC
ncbi:hypothetical protein L6452_15210 [Arctium lappa]|uniref:Uncharacterized protein n=1 Tax=Arctium lappa TaxID=4217 RepID=A0ACB9CNR4_ARCLA|nr:hypothetical protein L6452_15210 [Arctium lappa]